MKYYVGVDVGTQSVRAGLVTEKGEIKSTASKAISTWNPKPEIYEQSSDEIWSACCSVVKLVTETFTEPENICGIGFDATCSLVVLDENCEPVSVSNSEKEDPAQNIILWMDHRAAKQAENINSTKHEALKYVGGKISLEMELPKLLWLKENLPSCWSKAGHFFDLPDFCTWRATGSFSRSLCSLACKWVYQVSAESQGWNTDFLKLIGLNELTEGNFKKIGSIVQTPGECCGRGLTPQAAEELGLLPGTPVATSVIDAHAGGIGMLGCMRNESIPVSLSERLAMICGTSTCHMAVTEDSIFVPGIWGPYFSAMVPRKWLLEAGQSAAGILIDYIINTHPATNIVKQQPAYMGKNRHIQDFLNCKLANKYSDFSAVAEMASKLHVLPDFHGNRSPVADPSLKGMISGLKLSATEEDLLCLYVATIQALAYGTRHIIQSLQEKGIIIKILLLCGGLSKNPLYVKMHSDITGLPVILPKESESVLLGSAILAATAGKGYSTVSSAMDAMCGSGTIIHPERKYKSFHDKKYAVFLEMLNLQIKSQKLMK